jgi:hypothetical protein
MIHRFPDSFSSENRRLAQVAAAVERLVIRSLDLLVGHSLDRNDRPVG